MRPPKRRADPSVIARLRASPQQFEFFQAVRVLRRHFRRHAHTEHEPLGTDIRFRNSVNIGFAPSEIESLAFGPTAEAPAHREAWPATAAQADDTPFTQATLTPAFFGLTGTHGALPRAYTDHVIAREHLHRDRATLAFLDLFTNRAASQFYLAWEKHRLHLRYEHDRTERFLPMLLALVGLGSTADLHATCDTGKPLQAETLAFYGGALRQKAKPAHVIERVLADHFGVPVRLRQFAGRWLALDTADHSVLGMANATLGHDALCGERVWQCEDGVDVEIGPLPRAALERFLPGGDATEALSGLMAAMAGITPFCIVRLIVQRDDIAGARLDDGARAPRLGYDLWLLSGAAAEDSRDIAFVLPLDRPPAPPAAHGTHDPAPAQP